MHFLPLGGNAFLRFNEIQSFLKIRSLQALPVFSKQIVRFSDGYSLSVIYSCDILKTKRPFFLAVRTVFLFINW